MISKKKNIKSISIRFVLITKLECRKVMKKHMRHIQRLKINRNDRNEFREDIRHM